MRRRTALAIVGGVTMMPGAVLAQNTPGMLRVAAANAQPRSAPQWVAFQRRMAELGYVEGRNFIFDHLQISGPEAWEQGYRAVVGRKPDIVIATGPELSLRSALAATRDIPIIMIAIDYDPVALGLVADLGRPGGNVTGIHFQRVELTEKRLQLLKDAVPDVDAAIVFWDGQSGDQRAAAESAASALGLRHQGIKFDKPPYDFDNAAIGTNSARRPALFVLGSPFFFLERARLAEFALKRRMISSFVAREFVTAGGLMSYGVSLPGMWELAASYVDRIARGAKPGALPIQQPTKFELAVNFKTAKALGLAFAPEFLVRVDEIVE
jgi:putative ABC transport system substrate-binding protein